MNETSLKHDGEFMFLGYYMPVKNRVRDRFSAMLLSFKNGVPGDVSELCYMAGQAFAGMRFDFVVRAFGSQEKRSDLRAPLDHLGSALASSCGAKYSPNLLHKKRSHTGFHQLPTAAARREALNGLYKVQSTILEGARILVIDDVITTGTTLRAIKHVIEENQPKSNVTLFGLARTRLADHGNLSL